MLSAAQPTCFLIADISGYTGYLADVELDHAQDILADLVGAVVTALRPNFRLAKLEGDAAFTYAPAEKVDGSMLLDTIERCYFGFRRRRRDVRQATSCECNACVRIPDLDLKFVVHHGAAIHQKVAGRQELLGSDVIVVHRLLKNDVVEKLGMSAYALITQACIDAIAVDPAALGMTEITETYEHIGEVRAWVHDLERRWQEEDARAGPGDRGRRRLRRLDPDRRAAPARLGVRHRTRPAAGLAAGHDRDSVSTPRAAGAGSGTTNHCMHGKDAVIEEILDWRPYDYVTERTTMDTPMGPVKFVTTLEFEPTPAGTIVHFRFAPPKSAKERAIMREMAPMMAGMFQQRGAALAAQLEAELGARAGGEEPDLPTPRPDGVLASIARAR